MGAVHPAVRGDFLSGAVVVAPHPDDEVLGCSAVLHRAEVTVVHVTDGVPPWTAETDRVGLESRRAAESVEAWSCLSSRVECIRLGFGDLLAWKAVEEIAKSLTSLLDSMDADEVYLPAYQLGHPDHDATYLAGALSRRDLGEETTRTWWVYGLYGFDQSRQLTFGWLPPDTYSPVEVRAGDHQVLAAKTKALRCHKSQLWPDSALDLWIRSPVAEQFALLPARWERLPRLPCFYEEALGFGRHGASAAAVQSAFHSILAE